MDLQSGRSIFLCSTVLAIALNAVAIGIVGSTSTQSTPIATQHQDLARSRITVRAIAGEALPTRSVNDNMPPQALQTATAATPQAAARESIADAPAGPVKLPLSRHADMRVALERVSSPVDIEPVGPTPQPLPALRNAVGRGKPHLVLRPHAAVHGQGGVTT